MNTRKGQIGCFATTLALGLMIGGSAAATDCPAVPMQEAEIATLMDQLRVSLDPAAAGQITNRLWALWATAPDARAQEMLDRGMRRRSAWDLNAAWEAFDLLVAYCPHYAEGYNQRAFVAFLRGDYRSALPDLDRALELDPDHIAAMSGKALTLFGLGRHDEGQRVLRLAADLNPWLPERGMLSEDPGEDI